MVSRYTRFRVLLLDNTPSPHCDTPCDFNGLPSMLPKVGVLYGFRITRIAFLLIGGHTSDSVARGGIIEYGVGSVKHEKAAGSQFSAKWL